MDGWKEGRASVHIINRSSKHYDVPTKDLSFFFKHVRLLWSPWYFLSLVVCLKCFIT